MMNRMSFSETIFLFVLALIIFGPKKLPEIARQVGKYMNEFRRASNEFKAQIEQEIAHLEVEKPTILPPSPIPEGTASRTLTSSAAVESAVTETPAAETPASAVASDDEPLFASHVSSSADGPAPAVGEEAPSTTQESHA
jgi:sec-independent protein translocase protein TatB